MHKVRSKVYLVGAGPGNFGLLTLRAKEVLEQADVVIYDYLANSRFLQFAPPTATLINAGKRHGHPSISQPEINQRIIEEAQKGQIVVRLKGGDPFIFGRGAEELSSIIEADIPFEVVPGVSSLHAVPCFAGIPLTHRNYSSNVVFLTGVEYPEKPETLIDWDAISRMNTIVILMGLSRIATIQEKLLQHGVREDTPVSLIQWGTWSQQKSLHSHLKRVVEDVNNHSLKAPVLIIVGEVCQFHQEYNWFEKQPLFGQTILVTRNDSSSSSLTQKLEQRGAHVIYRPLLQIQPLSHTPEFDQVLMNYKKIDLVIFTSQNGVEYCMQKLKENHLDSRVFGNMQIACVGSSTAKQLEEYGLRADFLPQDFQSEGLIETFATTNWKHQNIWLPQAKNARPALEEFFIQKGANVWRTPIYETTSTAISSQELVTLLQSHEVDWITFASSSSVKNLFQLLSETDTTWLFQSKIKMACIGKITASTVREYGLDVHVTAKTQTLDGLVQSLIEYDPLNQEK